MNVGKPHLYEIGQIIEYVDLIDREEARADFAISDTAKWFCAVVNPNCHVRAVNGLFDHGYRTFYPKVRRWVSHARVRKAVEKPLLGRYLFVEVDHPRQSFGLIRAVNGIESMVSNPDPVQIPALFVAKFRERYMSGEWDEVANGKLPVGARIRIMEGEFANMLATVTHRKGRRIDFKLFEQNRYGRLNECSVSAA